MSDIVKKKIVYVLVFFLCCIVFYDVLFYFKRIQPFNVIEQTLRDHCFRIDFSRDLKLSCILNKTILDQKIKEGLPRWAQEQISKDLSHFKNIKKSDLDNHWNQTRLNLYHYQIKNNRAKVYFKKGFNPVDAVFPNNPSYFVIQDLLNVLASYGYLHDADFLMSLSDFFNPSFKVDFPIFVFAKDLDDRFEKDWILVPDMLNLMEVSSLRPSIRKASKKFPWKTKKTKIFWRGAASSLARETFVAWASQIPDVVDAQFVDGVYWTVPFVKPADHLKYKYLVSIDGARCAWTHFVWHLHSNSLVFKHNSHQVQWFYGGVKPYEHYLPFSDQQSLLEGLQWSEQHPVETQAIIQRASSFVEQNLSLEDMCHYYIVLINEYSKRL